MILNLLQVTNFHATQIMPKQHVYLLLEIKFCGVLLNLRIYAHLLNEMFCKRQFFLQFSSVCKFDTKTPDKD